MRNQRGFITVDFLIAIVVVMGFTTLLMVISLTLSVASVVQYITFAAARNYTVAHLDQATQEELGQKKYQELVSNPVFRPFFTNGWYSLSAEATIGDHTKIFPEYEDIAKGVNQFWGVGTDFKAKILDRKVAYVGATDPEGDGSGSSFKAYIASYLGREPSADECIQFTKGRWDAIRNLPASGGASYSSGTSANGYYTMTDDGC
jgi:hypothetical protein